MQTLVECVPNFSEGRDAQKVDAIIRALLDGPEVHLLDKEMDADHNRCVITLVGSREQIGEAALRGMGKALELIDLNHHQGAHPRLGATDVVPFVPISGVTLEDCVRIAEWVAEQAWRKFRIPTYLYEAAARRPERKNLENIRKGQFEGVREEVRTNPDRRPDFGENALHPTAGATVVGARKFLIAYNINLKTPDVAVAKAIAKKIRASSGGFACVKAMGVDLKAQNLAQVSMNLTDFETTSIGTVFDAVAQEAKAAGVEVEESEIVGLSPRRALEDAAVHYLKIKSYRPDLIVENRLASVLEETKPQQGSGRLRELAERFVAAVAADTPTPGGGSVSALAGALAAALGEMVSRLTLKKKTFSEHYAAAEKALARLAILRDQLLTNIDRDAESYEAVMAAYKLPKASDAEKAARAHAIEEASKLAASVPLETAKLAAEIIRIAESMRGITIPQAASDLTVAVCMAEAALAGAIENVHANLPSIQDSAWGSMMESQIQALTSER
ncbi:MAG TPA: glutamate formimidoyltransferase [Terriglobia bacterium]|nr:glutamate formimidoyltransferase [Terriglobia bacterium]